MAWATRCLGREGRDCASSSAKMSGEWWLLGGHPRSPPLEGTWLFSEGELFADIVMRFS